MNLVATSIKQMADAMERKSELEAKKTKIDERTTAINPSTLLQILRELEVLRQEDIYVVFEGLLADGIKGKASMAILQTCELVFYKGIIVLAFLDLVLIVLVAVLSSLMID